LGGQAHTEQRVNGPRPRVGRDRRHLFPGRDRRISPSFNATEHAEVTAAARRAGLTPTGFCAVAALAAARGEQSAAPPASAEYEAVARLQSELFDTRAAVNRVGSNLNQAVAALNSTGEAPVWLHTAVAMCARAVQALDEVISAIHRRIR
jgi:hypothetical protein